MDENAPPPPRPMVRIIGRIDGDGEVTITDPSWRASPQPTPAAAQADDGAATGS